MMGDWGLWELLSADGELLTTLVLEKVGAGCWDNFHWLVSL